MASTVHGPVVFLHIGEPKSGTTYLQDVLWGNREALARLGVHLPGLHPQDHFRANQDLREIGQAGDDPAGSWKGEWEILARQARSVRGAALISHELLSGATLQQASRAVMSLEPSEVHVILTVRDMASLLPAEWQETVKHRNTRSWEEWLGDIVDRPISAAVNRRRWFWKAHDTLDVLERWSRHLPPSRVHVIPVPPRGASPTLLWERFASVLGVDPSIADATRARANASLGLSEIELLRMLNAALPRSVPEWFYVRRVKESLAHDVLARRRSNHRPQLPPHREHWARTYAEKVVVGLESAGFDIVGDLTELLPTAPDVAPISQPQTPSAEDVSAAAVACLAALLEQEYRPPHAPNAGSSALERFVASSPRAKRTIRRLSNEHSSIARLRILSWHWAERARSRCVS